ncbi:uncharacterized protein LOC106131942 [Amyelois transitella]|uniref:uncharacterized protein LOC106131942 n=1 Tax=Amyelois transitella TaxID=680683 RepID=UPI00299022DF|nr:uncharacterized protein LOC106131942 [Amyelois transitella]
MALVDDLVLEDEETTPLIRLVKPKKKTLNKNADTKHDDYELVIPMKSKEKIKGVKDIDCMNFAQYATNCTTGAALIYNSARVTPPLPYKIQDWCKSIRHLTNCAIEWNTDCNESTDNFFNEDSIKGHMHVLDYICDDEWFLTRYRDMAICIEAASDQWQECYAAFKVIVEEQKNITREWTHFETHFYLCCAQAQFRRCTLDFIFNMPTSCPYDQAVTLQKFSVIVSEGDVFQECDGNVMYSNCPNGDPTPNQDQLMKALMDGGESRTVKTNSGTKAWDVIYLMSALQLFLINFCL